MSCGVFLDDLYLTPPAFLCYNVRHEHETRADSLRREGLQAHPPGGALLLADAFYWAMAVTIMFGLAFATVLTMVAVPVCSALVFRVRRTAADGSGSDSRPDAGGRADSNDR